MSAVAIDALAAHARFAVYYAPEVDSPWWQAGSTWLGRDAWRNETRVQLHVDASRRDLHDLTVSPRRYGWHGTLVPPFRLAAGVTPDDLLAATRMWANAQQAFALDVETASLGRFVALRPAQENGAARMRSLAADALQTLHTLRGRPTAAETEKRLRSPLSERQRELLLDWGYPYVLDEFRFHMTLSDSLDDANERDALAAAWRTRAATLGPLAIDRVALFVEPEPGAPFVMWHAVPFLQQNGGAA